MKAELEHSIQDALWHGFRSIADEQLPHGEIPNYRSLPEGQWEYCFSPLVSAYIYGALGSLDPSSVGFDLHTLECCGGRRTQLLGRMAFKIRHRIYRFLCWQQSVNGTWAFFGHGGSLPPDLDTTSSAALIFMDRRNLGHSCALRQTLAAISSFPASDGMFDSPASRGPAFSESLELRRVANANLLRCFALAGKEYASLADAVVQDFGRATTQSRQGFAWLYALGRAFRQGQVSILGEIASKALAQLSHSRAHGFQLQGPLSTALAISAWLDFGSSGVFCETDIASLVKCIKMSHRSRLETFCDERCGSPALTTAVAISALLRAAIMLHGDNCEA